MASFQAKIDWERPGKGENKNYRLISPYKTHYREFQKNSKKN